MRNGNLKKPFQYVKEHESSYRTYEEWKRCSFYNVKDMLMGSYRTYEEWKPIWLSVTFANGNLVLTVPMRNGNHHHQQTFFHLL